MGKDFLEAAFDEELLDKPIPVQRVYEPDPLEHWSYNFKDSHTYDWNDPWLRKKNLGKFAFRVIDLTKGYFMIVSPRDYKRMTTYSDGKPKKWYAHVLKSPKGDIDTVYARRRGRGDEPKDVYAHRELLNCLNDSREGDHVNGYGLDNRRCNLLLTRHNSKNKVSVRTVHHGLPRGVERRGVGGKFFGGIRVKRLSRTKIRTIRSKRIWRTPEPAARWYANQTKRICGDRPWIYDPKTVDFPDFPRKLLPPVVQSFGDEIPF